MIQAYMHIAFLHFLNHNIVDTAVIDIGLLAILDTEQHYKFGYQFPVWLTQKFSTLRNL